jgi:hypothetical protein
MLFQQCPNMLRVIQNAAGTAGELYSGTAALCAMLRANGGT